MNDLETRVAALESANRRYRVAFGASLFVLVALALTGFGQGATQPQDLVKAKKFQLVDDKGNVIGSMEGYKGAGSFSTYNADGNLLVDTVTTDSGAGAIVVYDGKRTKNVVVTDTVGGGGSIRLNNGSGDGALILGENDHGAGSITLNNKQGKKIGLITGDTEESGAVITYNSSGTQTDRMPH